MNRRPGFRSTMFAVLAAGLASCLDVSAPVPTDRPVAAPISSGSFDRITAGDYHTCGLTASNEALCWGTNSQGQSGNGFVGSTGTPTPLPVLGGYAFNVLYAGGGHTCGIETNGASVCWGNNAGGQLGDGTTITRFEPTPVSGSLPFVSLSASTTAHTCGLLASGKAYCWGTNSYGQLGDGTTSTRLAPVAVLGSTLFSSITAGGFMTCGLTSGGDAYCWGANFHGELGDGTNADRLAPVPVATTLKFTQLVAGLTHVCGLVASGAAYCWGDNVAGNLGDSTTASKNSPTPVAGGYTFMSITLGERHACGLTFDNLVYCWGYNASGALGDGTYLPHPYPVAAIAKVLFAKLAAGAYYTCGISVTGTTYCWGDNSFKQLGSNE